MSERSPEERFNVFYAATFTDVLRFLRRRMDPEGAEDVAHEAFLVVWRRLDDLPARQGEARAWVFGIARRCLLAALRKQGRDAELTVRVAHLAPPPATTSVTKG